MTTYGAYDAGLPCKNSACKSHGKPHPNCRCYGDMAEGGEAGFCSSDRAHEKGCEYFAEGGGVGDFDSLQEDPAPNADALPAFDDLKEDNPEAPKAFDDLVEDDPNQENPANEDLDPAALQAKMVAAAHPDGIGKYETPGQQVATVAEGASRGIGGELATLAENKLLGVPLEDIRGRQEANPNEALASEVAGFGGSLATGAGTFGLATKAGATMAEYARLGKVGANALKYAVANLMTSAADVGAQQWMGENPEHAAASIILSTGLGALTGGLGAKAGSQASTKLTSMAEEKMGTKLSSWLAGVGHASNPEYEKLGLKGLEKDLEGKFSPEMFAKGKEFYKSAMENAGGKIANAVTQYITGVPGGRVLSVPAAMLHGFKHRGVTGAVAGGLSAYALPHVTNTGVKGLEWVSKKVTAPAILKLLTSGKTEKALEALDHMEKVEHAIKGVDVGIESLFGKATAPVQKGIKNAKALEEWIDGGGHTQDIQQHLYDQAAPQAVPAFAKGGEVTAPAQEDAVAMHFPDQNILMQAAKARASNYLNSLRPAQHAPKLAFDEAPDTREQKKTYKRALDIAAQPMMVLDKIKKGTIDAEDIKHLNSMFPEATGYLQKKITEKISRDQLSGKKPNYRVRQGLSMLMGTALSGELTPQNIAAAQAVFANKQGAQAGEGQPPSQQSGQGGGKPPSQSSTSLTHSSRSFLTDDQALMKRQQRTG